MPVVDPLQRFRHTASDVLGTNQVVLEDLGHGRHLAVGHVAAEVCIPVGGPRGHVLALQPAVLLGDPHDERDVAVGAREPVLQ